MSGFEFSVSTLEALEQVQGRSGVGRGRVDHRGNRKLGQALGSLLRTPEQILAASVRGTSRGGAGQAARSARALDTLARTARRAPEVMVKLTGRQHESGNVVANFTYISRLGHDEKDQVELLTSERQVLTDGRDMLELARSWHAWELGDESRRKGATSLSMVFSMPPGTDPEKLRQAVIAFADTEMSDRRWVLALHTDADHPHVHLTVARRNLDGTRFHPNRDDFQHYRERFADLLVERGIDAAATPRRARGIVPKKDPIPVIKIREKGQEPRVDQLRRDGAEDAVRDNAPARPLDGKAAERIAMVRDVYMRAVGEIEARGSAEDKAIAKSLQAFVDQMPEPLSRMAAMVLRIKEGRGLSPEAKPDAELERLRARVASRKDGQRDVFAEANERLRQAREASRARAAAVAPGLQAGPFAGLNERLLRSIEASKELPAPTVADGAPGALSGSKAMSPPPAEVAPVPSRRPLSKAQLELERILDAEKVRQRERAKDRDKDRDGPSR